MREICRKLKNIFTTNKTTHYQKTYSQEGEDLILDRIFKGKNYGFYVDIGAHHPIRFSNTYKLYNSGWRGINVDATPGTMVLFNKIRPRDINVEIGISTANCKLDLLVFNAPKGLTSATNTFKKERSKLIPNEAYKVITVDCITLTELLEQKLPESTTQIDLLTIDIEGLDLEVLKSNNWDKYKPKVIIFEIHRNSNYKLELDHIKQYLSPFGYSLYSMLYNSHIFMLND